MADPLAGLDLRQRKYLENRAKGFNKLDAARRAGYSEHMARAAAVKVERPEVRAAFARLIRQYVPAHRIAQRIQEGLDAMETKFFQKEGVVTDQRDVINWSERRAYAELAANLGEYTEPTEANGNAGPAVNVTIHMLGVGVNAPAEATRTLEALG